ncbi:ABC transporter permease subunit [candidate division KSB3 bacterium]|uniref:ABC transporter permease subunit n=1 Tax=candidate division KSB3 bacterium TaxID=2044937 RepID=A0A9D5Q562_9BACT|nr:ABC transporter permease subunit [candidate division KSB3 bacterium]MBD3324255.1 ABC transporter permease subunit [candidate division KSB3 bacterium]
MEYLVQTLRRHYQTLLVILGFFVVWQVAVILFEVREFILPSPLVALEHLFLTQPDANYNWTIHISTTLYEVVISFAFTSLVGVAIAITMAWSQLFYNMVLPVFIFINSLPIIAIAPIILLWFGYGIMTNVLIAFLVSFFPVVINTATGLHAVEEELFDLVRYLHASRWQIFMKIQLPNSLPYLFTGLKICSTMCVVGAIVGEFIASDRGLGYIIINSQYTMDTPPIFAALILVSVIGGVLFGLVALAEKLLMPWHQTDGPRA